MLEYIIKVKARTHEEIEIGIEEVLRQVRQGLVRKNSDEYLYSYEFDSCGEEEYKEIAY